MSINIDYQANWKTEITKHNFSWRTKYNWVIAAFDENPNDAFSALGNWIETQNMKKEIHYAIANVVASFCIMNFEHFNVGYEKIWSLLKMINDSLNIENQQTNQLLISTFI